MHGPLRVLIVEDSQDDTLVLVRQLCSGGYEPILERVDTAEAMRVMLDKQPWDIVVTGYNMPHFSALAALALIKEKGLDLPFIIVYGCIREETAVAAMEAGAHDYIFKDNLGRLVPTVVRELREAKVRQERKQAEEALRKSQESLCRMMEGAVRALASLTEKRDPYTAGHQRRVAQLARAIAGEIGLPQIEIEGIHIAGLLHDIGKIIVPAEILSKPGKISEWEFNIIRMHPQVGYDILKEIEFPWPVGKVILQHHEMVDGSGYPAGLRGSQILTEARVLAVADAIEAMSSHRPYLPARGVSLALEEITQFKGILYDPQVVEACWRVFYEKEFQW